MEIAPSGTDTSVVEEKINKLRKHIQDLLSIAHNEVKRESTERNIKYILDDVDPKLQKMESDVCERLLLLSERDRRKHDNGSVVIEGIELLKKRATKEPLPPSFFHELILKIIEAYKQLMRETNPLSPIARPWS